MSSIKILEMEVVKQLKASLVITSMEQCIEELVKNALDAEATSIEVQVDLHHSMIQVDDNGTGIPPSDLTQLAQRHVTSKCHTLMDLYGTRTFGFRGEALAALATMSILQITSRHQGNSETHMTIWKDGHLIQQSICKENRRPGTTVIIPSLFYKYPVRQKYQHTSLDTIKHTLTKFALIFPQVNFTLTDRVRDLKCMVTKKCANSFGVFRLLFGQRFAQEIKPYSIHEDQLRLHGYFGRGVPVKVHQYIYINRHYISPLDSDLYKRVTTIIQLHSSSERLADEHIRKGRDYPLFLIKIDCPCISSYDIPFLSGHGIYPRLETLLERLTLQYLRSASKLSSSLMPVSQSMSSQTKKRKRHDSPIGPPEKKRLTSNVYLDHSFTHLPRNDMTDTQQFGRNVLNNYPSQPRIVNSIDRSWLRRRPDRVLDNSSIMINLPSTSTSPILSLSSSPSSSSSSSLSSSMPSSSMTHPTSPLLFESLSSVSLNDTLSSPSPSVLSKSTSASSSLSLLSSSSWRMSNSLSGLQAPQKLHRQDLASAKVLAQVDCKWIVCLLERMLILVDQHAADERIKLEGMLNSDINSKYLEPYLPVTLTAHQFDLAMKYQSDLEHWGIFYQGNNPPYNHITHLHREKDINIGSPHFTHRRQLQYEASPHFIAREKNKKDRQRLVVTKLPHLIVDRCTMDSRLLTELICDYLHALETGTISSSTCPPVMMDLLKSKACRGAIMFNDPLSIEQCTSLIKSLSRCRFPFQCAHGRPSVVPLVNLGHQYQRKKSRVIRWDAFLT